ncbi:hypothetical protein PN451_14430 [Dolichospermum planctonicum CS-1226]|uniref:Uncharacterized protein n=1 Tax=Dolichospermum planctonicum CS-1226 TaxID=3021751 RepID=A0ABT5AJZ4_9CYAN|nr:hypothetical protein [Dolichospermum planctonicum CS-1226]
MTREQGRGFGQLYFSLLVSVFSVHLLIAFSQLPITHYQPQQI